MKNKYTIQIKDEGANVMEFKLSSRSYGKTLSMRMRNEYDAFIIKIFRDLINKDFSGYTKAHVMELMQKEEFKLIDIWGDSEHPYDIHLKNKKVGEIRRKCSTTNTNNWTIECKFEFKKCEE